MNENCFTFYSVSPTETEVFGETIGRLSGGGELLLLEGTLGAGKTVMVKGIAKGLDIKNEIVSPTFIIIRSYKGRLILNHIDLYRIDSIDGLGLEEYLDDKDSITVIEWGEKLLNHLPLDEYLLVRIDVVDENSRGIVLEPRGERYIEYTRRIKDGISGY